MQWAGGCAFYGQSLALRGRITTKNNIMNLNDQIEMLVEECWKSIREEAANDGECADFSNPFYSDKLAYAAKQRLHDILTRYVSHV